MILKLDNLKELEIYLKAQNWLGVNNSVIKVEKPGEGNMNFTLRVYTSTGNAFIIKQSRDYVEKYPSIPAPKNRAIIEGNFYQFTQKNVKLGSSMPALLGIDKENNIIVLQDLGTASDFTNLYQPNKKIEIEEIKTIVEFLTELHKSFKNIENDDSFANCEMRALNHEHIFKYPFMVENGFNLDTVQEGLQNESMTYKLDVSLKEIIEKLGEIYLDDGNYLLHGDYYFGSFLRTNNGVKIIDPEFCFYGHAEFDLAVLIAHLKMSEQSQEIIDLAITNYEKADDFNGKLFNQFVGVEIMRRIIGLAQLPITLTLKQRIDLLKEAKLLINNDLIPVS